MKSSYRLDATASDRVIENAIHTHAQIVLEFSDHPQQTVNGFLISGDEKALLMEITGKPAVAPQGLVHASCCATLYSDHRYSFPTEIPAAPAWGNTRSVVLARPTILTVLERRRYVRAKLAPSCHVNLEWMQSGACFLKTAVLLNISVDGLACRLSTRDAASLPVGQPVLVQFELPESSRPFKLQAETCNRTPTDDDHVIIGMQFADSSRHQAQRDALSRVLTTRPTETKEVEALA